LRRALALLLSTAAVLAALYLYFRPQPAPPPPPAQAGAAQADAAAPAASDAHAPLRTEFVLTVAGGKLVSGPAVIQVTQGTEVTIRIRSDRTDELHLHGYDLHARVDAGEPAELTFEADRTGRFEYELRHSQLELGVLEVRPE
jgi:hypothetical protein